MCGRKIGRGRGGELDLGMLCGFCLLFVCLVILLLLFCFVVERQKGDVRVRDGEGWGWGSRCV